MKDGARRPGGSVAFPSPAHARRSGADGRTRAGRTGATGGWARVAARPAQRFAVWRRAPQSGPPAPPPQPPPSPPPPRPPPQQQRRCRRGRPPPSSLSPKRAGAAAGPRAASLPPRQRPAPAAAAAARARARAAQAQHTQRNVYRRSGAVHVEAVGGGGGNHVGLGVPRQVQQLAGVVGALRREHRARRATAQSAVGGGGWTRLCTRACVSARVRDIGCARQARASAPPRRPDRRDSNTRTHTETPGALHRWLLAPRNAPARVPRLLSFPK